MTSPFKAKRSRSEASESPVGTRAQDAREGRRKQYKSQSSFCYESPAFEAGVRQKTHRIPQFENEDVEVWRTSIFPKQPLKMHRHDHSRVIVALTDLRLKVENDKGSSYYLKMDKGSAKLLQPDKVGELHSDLNESDHPMEVMIIQFKKK